MTLHVRDLGAGFRVRPGLRVQDFGREVVVLDVDGGVVHRLIGPAADACRDLLRGDPPEPEIARGLVDAGVLVAHPDAGVVARRRTVLTGAALGVVSTVLPGATAAASTLTLSEGGSAYLTVSGPAATSSAATGSLQYASFTQEVVGTRTATPSADLTVEVLLVGGGGGGATGGGGGGEVVRQILPLTGGRTYDIDVGVGGSAGVGSDGSPGTASSLTRAIDSVVVLTAAGGAGGAEAGAGGASTFSGGAVGERDAGGGGGGAGSSGSDAVGGTGGAGGSGREIVDFISPSVVYGGGGGGGSYTGSGGNGGNGGGGAGGTYGVGEVNGQAGDAATGGGGGGASPYGGGSGAGGTGLVIIRYYGASPEVELGFGGAG